MKVKNLAEERMAKMDKEVKDLRDRFNKQAVNRLSEDQVLLIDTIGVFKVTILRIVAQKAR